MREGSLPVLILSAAMLLGSPACISIQEPEAPECELPEASECSLTCECEADDITGRAFRFTRLEVEEPQELASVLNNMWAGEVRNNILNVIVEVVQAVPGTVLAQFDSISLSVGPGWRDPKMPYSLEPAEGEPSESVVDSYCMLEGLDVDIELGPYRDHQCLFKSTEAGWLYFHLGARNDPLVCAPLLEPQNATPIKELKVRLGFNQDCTAIRDGWLEGCITEEDADRLCICMIAGTCEQPVDPEAPFDPQDPSGYCSDACGSGWLSFGGIAGSLVSPSCLTSEGKPGYRLQAFFDAVDVSDKFNPQKSLDCTQR